ncbi:TetR/AcrR family transcriptional regulator [Kiloniella sp. EL199]|uniref:TetR/AcrR family transcriptional regulator n=1 Tax=Kiloniella sp. EL199 TaxID=2107581 RepID=UPI000EA40535|nr:TetR/AcrR family transcriptional regulator [Kiloniella sp. EL199]
MGRNLSFDEKETLAKVVNIFREKGYEATTVKDLEKATGLTSGSLYNSFGGKEALFDIAISFYNNNVVRNRISTFLDQVEDPLSGMKDLFRSLLNEPDGQENGCLLTNTAVEFNNRRRHTTQELDTGFSLLEAAFKRQIIRCTEKGQIAKHSSAQQAAIRLLVFYQGILVLVRAGLRRKEIEQIIDDEIDLILRREF